MPAPTVAVVIPTHNRWPLVADAVTSAYDQQVVPDEVVVVDDGSTDGTATRVRELFPHLRVVEQSNAGRSAARNRGLAAVETSYVIFLDDDDVLEPWQVAQFQAAWSATRDDAVFAAPARLWDAAAGRTRAQPIPDNAKRDARRACLWGMAVPLQGLVVPVAAAQAAGGFPPLEGSEDWVFLARLAARLPLRLLPRPGVRIREHPGRSMHDPLDRIRWRQIAAELVLDEGVGGAPLRTEERQIVLAGMHRFCAAHYYVAGDMGVARRELRAARRAVGGWRGVSRTGRLWLQTWLRPVWRARARRWRDRLVWR